MVVVKSQIPTGCGVSGAEKEKRRPARPLSLRYWQSHLDLNHRFPAALARLAGDMTTALANEATLGSHGMAAALSRLLGGMAAEGANVHTLHPPPECLALL